MDISEEEFNKQHLKYRKKEEKNIMPIRIVADRPKTAKKGKAGKAKVRSYNKGGRTGKQFGGGLSRPLGGMRAPVGAMGPRRLGIKKGGKA